MSRLAATVAPLILATGLLTTAAAPATAAPAPTKITETLASPAYTAAQVSGTWSSMGLPPIQVAANRALGPASRVLLHLPEFLRKGGRADYALAPDGVNAWKAVDGPMTVSFSLQSENAAVLKMDGAGKEQHLNLPVVRW